MKKLLFLTTLFILIAAQVNWGQSLKTIEGLAIDSKGVPLPDGNKEITFNIYDSSDGDILLWSELQTVPIKEGRFAATLGQVNALDDLTEDTTYWLTMKVGAGEELSPRLELTLGGDETTQNAAAAANTLDEAYDGGGVGAGRTIAADAGAVHILGSDGAVPNFPSIGGKDFLVSENNGNSNVSIIGGATNSSALKFFPSGATGNVGVINYNYANNRMSFGTVNGSTRMTIDAANGIGIGTVAPNGQLGLAQVSGTNRWLDILGDSNAEVSISIQPQNTNTTALARGLSIVPVMKASTAGTAGYGVQIDTQPQANLNGFSYGTLAIAQLSNSSSNVTSYFPMYFRFDTQATYSGAIDTVDVFRIDTPVLAGSKPGNIAGLNIANQGGIGTTNAYGLRIKGQSGAIKNWNIYSEGANSLNYFEGRTGIGTSGPLTMLDIVEPKSGGTTAIRHENSAAGATSNQVGMIHRLNTDAQSRIGLQILTSFNDIADANRNSLVKFQTHNAGTFVNALAIDGNEVGVGTLTPDAKLHIAGDVKIVDGTQGAGKVLTSDVNGLASWQTPSGGGGGNSIADADDDTKVQTEESADEDKIRFDTNGIQRMIINTNGRVGIGKSNPASILDIVESVPSGATVITHENTGAFSTGNQALFAHRLRTDTQSRAAFQVVSSFNDIADANRNSLVKFQTHDAGTFVNALAIDGSNIGLGTTNPQALLHMKGDFDALRFETGVGGAAGLNWYENSTAKASIIWDAGVDKLSFFTGGTSGAANNKMNILQNGNVGIGETAPDALLHIKNTTLDPGSASASDYHLFIETNTGTGAEAGIGFGNNNVGAAIIYEDNGSQSKGELVFYTKSSSTAGAAPLDRMRINENGQIRLGRGTGLGTGMFIDGSPGLSPGRIGMGTDAPANFVHVSENVGGSTGGPLIGEHVMLIQNTNVPGFFDESGVLALKFNDTDPDDYANFITFYDNSKALGRIEGNNNGGVNYKSGGADFAELLPRQTPGENMEAGEIVAVIDGKITKNITDAQQLMVVSTAPAFTGNTPRQDSEYLYEQVAFVGQVPVKVHGVVKAGNYIIPSGFNDGTGVAVAPDKISSEQVAQIVGRAWESSNDAGLKKVNAAVGLNRPELVIGKLMQTVQSQKSELADTKTELTALKKQVGQLQSAVQTLLAAPEEPKKEKMYARK